MRTEIVRLLHAVATASNEASSPSEAISSSISEICKYTGWSVGQAYLVPENAPNELILVHVWHSSNPEKYRLFREATHAAPVIWGADIAGRVLATAKPEWRQVLPPLGAPPTSRFQVAEECGLKSGFGFPVLVGREVAAVLEFFSDTEVVESSEVSETIELVASQLARVIERHWAERDLLRAREAAIDASSAKSDFLTQMSHEIRTPINAVMGMAQLLLGTTLSKEQQEYAQTIRQSVESLLSVVKDVLDISKIEAGKFDMETVDFQLENELRDTSSMLLHLVKGKGLQFSSTVDPSIPKVLRGDSGRLKQILVNLIGNAIKFTDEGRISILVLQQDECEDSVVLRFEIEDTGIGIPQEMHSKIFEMFTQVDMSPSRKFGGTGLGLSISRRLVEMMGGEVGFQSKEGIGSVFWFTVRLETLRRNSPALPPVRVELETVSETTIEESRLEKSSVSILVVEDNPINQKIVVRLLEKKGFHVDAVDSGMDALSAIENDPYDIILMDCQMPEMDGYETTRRIRQWEVETKAVPLPIIAVTANALKGDRERCLLVGMNDYLPKPVDTEVLVSTLEYWVQWRRTILSKLSSKRAGLDASRIKNLKKMSSEMDGSLFAELLSLFKTNSPGHLKKIETAIRSKNAELLGKEAHYLKSSSANLGAAEMSDVCRKLEMIAENGSLDDAAELGQKLQVLFTEACQELEKEATSAV
jgi:signal transduction histidine kinase/DNA-binding NarL/FixJ family response regulator